MSTGEDQHQAIKSQPRTISVGRFALLVTAVPSVLSVFFWWRSCVGGTCDAIAVFVPILVLMVLSVIGVIFSLCVFLYSLFVPAPRSEDTKQLGTKIMVRSLGVFGAGLIVLTIWIALW